MLQKIERWKYSVAWLIVCSTAGLVLQILLYWDHH